MDAFFDGFLSFFRGLIWFKKNPKYLLVLYGSCIVAFILFWAGIVALAMNFSTWFDAYYFKLPNDNAWWLVPYYLGIVLIVLGVVCFWAVSCMAVLNVISSPFFDVVSKEMEAQYLGRPAVEMSFWRSLSCMGTEIKKSILILFVSLFFSFVPPFSLFTPFVVSFLLAWDFFDYPYARRGLSLSLRVKRMRQNASPLFGLSIWLLIPGVSLLLYPLALGGATHIAMKALKEQEKT
jgi:CysZ protein